MFFLETQIAQTLNCPMCKSVLEDPRMLPCGETVCNSCIVMNTSTKQFGLLWNEPRFKCLCEQEHPVPAQGFVPNKIAASLADKKPVEVFRGAGAKQLSERLSRVSAAKTKLVERDAAMETVVRNYYDFLRSEVQLAADSLMKDVVMLRVNFIRDIDELESKCLEKIKQDAEFQVGFKKSIAEADKFVETWSAYLGSPEISRDEIEKGINESRLVEKTLDHENERMKKHAFNNKVPSFKASTKKLEKSQLGTLSIEFLEKLMLDKMAFLDVSAFMKESPDLLAIESFENGNYLFVSCRQESGVPAKIRYCLATFDQNSNPLRTYTLPFDVCPSQKDAFHVITCGNKTVFALTGPNSRPNQQQVYVFDEELKVTAQMPHQIFNSQIQCVDADSESIYVLHGGLGRDSEISQFSWTLEKQERELKSLNKQLAKHATHLHVRRDLLLLVSPDLDQIMVLDKSDGSLIRKLAQMNVASAEIRITDENVVLKEAKSNRIKFYDFNGELASEVQIDKIQLSKLKFNLNKATRAPIFYDNHGVFF